MNILESERLLLRNTRLEDINELYKEVFSDEEVVKFTFGKELSSFKEAEEFIKSSCNFDKNLGLSTLVEKSSQKIIGLAGVIECEYLETIDYEFGFILGRSFWGKGYATEIGQAQIDFIQNKIKAERVIALVYKDNIASVKTIEKLGLKYHSRVETLNRGSREVYLKYFEDRN